MSDQSSKITAAINSLTNQQIIRKFKLNHGLILTGYNIRPSIQAVVIEEDCKLKKGLYKEQPLVFTYINPEVNETPDTCINFPVFEINYNGNLLKSFLEFSGDEKELHELYGQSLARKFVAGGQLFIKDFNSATQAQQNVLKFYLFCVYNSFKYSTEIQFSNLFKLNLLPKIETMDGEKLDTHEKLVNWMNNLYLKLNVCIIFYDNLIPISKLNNTTINDLETFNDKRWSGFSNFIENKSLEEWVGDAMNDNLMSWASDFNLFQGLIINKNDEIEVSKKIPVDIIKIPKVNPTNTSYMKNIKPSTKLEFALISNNIFSIKNLSNFPFTNDSHKSYEGYNHVLVKCEKYEIHLNTDIIKPTKEFEQVIEKALNSMKPLKALQDVFNEYGHLFPRRIILGILLKNISSNIPSSITLDDVNDVNKILESLDNLNISYLLTQKGRVIERNDLTNWNNNTNNNLEIIEFSDIIPLYQILDEEKRNKINKILEKFNNHNIIMTGMTKLEDLDNENIEHYKRIDLGSSLEDKDYEVFGSIISENNSKFEKLEEIYVNFGLYDFNGFYAIIKKVEETSINIAECYVSWIVIGKPSQLSVFSPKNRELQAKCIKESIKLQPNKRNYTIGTSFTLHEGYTVFAHANHSPINCEPNNIIKLVEWKENSINFQVESAYKLKSDTNDESSSESDSDHENNNCSVNEVNLRICILSTDYKSLKIDNDEERECSLDLIGYILIKENFNENLFNVNKNEVSFNIHDNKSVTNQPLDFQLKALKSNEEIINIETRSRLSDRISIENSGSPSKNDIASSNLKNVSFIEYKINNHDLLKLEEDGFITPDEKAGKLIKELTKTKCLYALKLLFEDPLNKFSPDVLRNSLIALADPTSFNYIEKETMVRLELHMRTWAAVLEQICFSLMHLNKELRDKVYNSLTKFAEIHRKTQVLRKESENNYGSDFNQFQHDSNRNYNIDFLMIHLRDTLHSLHGDETWFHEILRKTKSLLKNILNISPGKALTNDSFSSLSSLTQLRQSLSFKYPVASYYVDWRIMLVIHRNLLTWSESSEMIISKKFRELVLMEYFWSFLEKEWINVTNKSTLDSQTKFDEVSNKVTKSLKYTGSFLTVNEPLTLPHTLWFGILDLAQNLIQKTTRTSIYGLCYYLAIESLNKAPSNFIQFKAIEILVHLYNIDNQMFSMIEIDFDKYTQKLNENNSTTDSSEKFQKLLKFVKEKYIEEFKISNDDIEIKGKRKEKNLNQEQTSNIDILNVIADEITCPVSNEPTDQLCVLKCQHLLSLNNLKKLRQKICPECREKIDDNDIRYLPQTSIYKNLYSKFSESGYILPTNELELDNQYDSDNSEVNSILTKKKKFGNAIKLNSHASLSSLLPRFSKKQHPTYQNIIKEISGKDYKEAESLCKDFLNFFPKSYSMRCILAYIYICLNNYEQACLYLHEAINLKEKKPIAWYIRGEIYFRENKYKKAIDDLNASINRKAKINNLYIILGNSYLFEAEKMFQIYYDNALINFNIALQSNPNHYLCLRSCAYIYEKQENYLSTLEMLDKLLSVDENDSLILCYYGEILSKIGRYNDAILYFTKSNVIDPENIHNLNERAIVYYVLQEYDKALLDLVKVIQLDPLNNLAYYYKGLVHYAIENANEAMLAFKKCIELDSNDDLAEIQLNYLKYLSKNNGSKVDYDIITKISQISNIYYNKSLLFLRCKIYIELEEYLKAKSDLGRLFILNEEDISFICLLRKYSDFWSELYINYKINEDDFKEFGIVDKFSKLLYKVINLYFISNLTNLNNGLNSIKESESNSLSGQVFCFKDDVFYLNLPKLTNDFTKDFHYVSWKINVKKILSQNAFVKFSITEGKKDSNKVYPTKEYLLRYNDLSKFEGLGWIEYTLPIKVHCNRWIQLSIEVNKGSVDMRIDYVRFKKSFGKQIYFPKMGHFLPIHKLLPNVPKAFKDNYFSRKEMENLLLLKDIIE
ncbi:TPR-like protein [Rhizophagus irregularis]|uniref:TPR-like protein n=1 Tax=Rhizophagus irregularis TaxID=588596 RepID=A0A2I1GCF9_9GLOM|nr:TPR-like protein [Rhizophagus irregularis]